ncbi:hypothetical protein FACS189418_2410 [Clostridia bacterium]|nr:hypothetical protein FACS189418_2410 [Clostridia bacterium]
MKMNKQKIPIAVLVLILCISFSTFLIQTSYSAELSMLDMVYDDGTVIPYRKTRALITDTESFEGDGTFSEETPEFPDNLEYLDTTLKNTRTIFGSDDRKIVSNTTVSPYRKVVFLTATFPNGQSIIGTGNMISKNTVLTAGHCIYKASFGGWAKKVTVYPGYNGRTAPYGSASSTQLLSVSGWVNHESYQHDMGAVILNKNIGNTVGWFGLTTQLANTATLSAYHQDQNKKQGTQTGNLMESDTNNVYYQLDSKAGSSGGGIYNASQQIFAINAYESNFRNMATRINAEKLSIIYQWAGIHTSQTEATPSTTAPPASTVLPLPPTSTTTPPIATQSAWQFKNGYWYYYSNGKALTNSLVFYKNYYYYLDFSGRMVTDSLITTNNSTYYFTEDGYHHTGWLYIHDIWYYFLPNGRMIKGQEYPVDGQIAVFNSNGVWIRYK